MAGREIVKRVEEVAKKKGVSMAQIAIAWVLANNGLLIVSFILTVVVSGAIVGISSKKRLDEAVAGIDIELTSEEKKYLEEPYLPRQVVGHS